MNTVVSGCSRCSVYRIVNGTYWKLPRIRAHLNPSRPTEERRQHLFSSPPTWPRTPLNPDAQCIYCVIVMVDVAAPETVQIFDCTLYGTWKVDQDYQMNTVVTGSSRCSVYRIVNGTYWKLPRIRDHVNPSRTTRERR